MSTDKNDKAKIKSKSNTILHGYFFEDLENGMEATFTKTIRDSDVKVFSDIWRESTFPILEP